MSAESPAMTIALLPFLNNTSDPAVVEVFEPLLRARLRELGIRVPNNETLRQVFRAHRIRAVGEIPTSGARVLQSDLSAPLALTGSYDVFLPHEAVPEAALSLRLVDLSTMTVIWARSVGSTGKDYETLLGLGDVITMDGLAARLIDQASKGIIAAIEKSRASSGEQGVRVAVIPFDDIVLDAPGSGIVTAQTITQLVDRGFTVMEPGAVRELFFSFQRFPRGGIDYELLTALHDSLAVRYVITGAVDRFRAGVPDVEQSYPSLAIHGRVIDTQTRRITRAVDVSGDGDHEIALGMGNTHAAAGVTRATTSHMLNKLHLKEGARVQ